MIEIAPCPCGNNSPTNLEITSEGSKYSTVCATCCGEWMIEFRSNFAKPGSLELRALALEAWNDAPRGGMNS